MEPKWKKGKETKGSRHTEESSTPPSPSYLLKLLTIENDNLVVMARKTHESPKTVAVGLLG